MLNYVALVWNDDVPAEIHVAESLKRRIRHLAPEWQAILDSRGMYVSVRSKSLSRIDNIYPLMHGKGVVVGQLFERRYIDTDDLSSPCDVSFDAEVSRRVVADAGETLRDNFWGQYVAFLIDAEASRKYVLRDPTGGIPCQLLTIGGVVVYFVRLEDVEQLEKVTIRLNKHFLVCTLFQRHVHSEETGIEGVSTVLAGQRVAHSGRTVTRTFYWDPVKLANIDAPTSFVDACSETHRVVRASVHAWTSRFDGLSLQLSGGLDSSIIASCLASAPRRPRVTCVNFYNRQATVDERVYAREVARRYGFDLLELPTEPRPSLDLIQAGKRTVVPVEVREKGSQWSDTWKQLDARGAAAHVRGDGGDDIFYRLGPLPAAVDFAYRYGLRAKLWSVAMDDAIAERTSVWEILRLAALYGLLRKKYEWRARTAVSNVSLFSDRAKSEVAEDKTFLHPLYRDSAGSMPAKFYHSFILLRYSTRFYMGPGAANALLTLAPLVSQPSLEFSLRTPLRVLRQGGRDRAVARSAFADDVPASIINRRYKGLGTPLLGRWMSENVTTVRELLLGGYLANEGIIDSHALEALLATCAVPDRRTMSALKAMMCVEVWIRRISEVSGAAFELPLVSQPAI